MAKQAQHPITAELAVTLFIWRTNIRSAMALKSAFALQVFGMMLNDMSFVIVWLIFFKTVGTVNGWNGLDAIALLACSMMGFGLAFSFAAGSMKLPTYIENGSFDNFLLSPRNLYLRTITSQLDVPALGDVIIGFILLIVYAIAKQSIAALLIPLALMPALVSIYVAVNVICMSSAFFMMDAQYVAHSFFKSFLTPSLYPSALFPKAMRFIFTFIIPALAVGGLPIETVKQSSPALFVTIYLIAIFWLALSVLIFYRAVRRYESGNALGMRS